MWIINSEGIWLRGEARTGPHWDIFGTFWLTLDSLGLDTMFLHNSAMVPTAVHLGTLGIHGFWGIFRYFWGIFRIFR